jgi:aspartate aminotransferase-like enzyme
MFQAGPYHFKLADSAAEVEQIHALNHATFVREIPQHHDPGDGRLVDKFHDKNLYFVAKRGERVIGMLSVHDQPPFSIADRLPDPTFLDAPGMRPLEVRLLAIEPVERASAVFGGLAWSVMQHVRATGHTHLFISGFEDRRSLYEGLGFEPLGPAVGPSGSRFVPMCLPVSRLEARHARNDRLWQRRLTRVARPEPLTKKPHWACPSGSLDSALLDPSADCSSTESNRPPRQAGWGNDCRAMRGICLLPGPVTLSTAVRAALQQPPLYHRDAEFIDLFENVRGQLGKLVGGRDVALFLGSGTLANDVVAVTLAASRSSTRGLILENGEFGRRLVEQAERAGLQPRVMSWPWGRAWDLEAVAAVLEDMPPESWVWGVHHETSTGVMNDLPSLIRLARSRGVRVCVDAVSSLGALPLDLRDVFLASGTSGKALGAVSGLAFVFADRSEIERSIISRVPAYLDLLATLTHIGPRFTFPSPLLQALAAALTEYATPAHAAARFECQAALGRFVREQLRSCHLMPLADERCASPTVTTFAPPNDWTSTAFAELCRKWGFLIGGQSDHLAARRLVQIATMGAITRDHIQPLFERLHGQFSNAGHPEVVGPQMTRSVAGNAGLETQHE